MFNFQEQPPREEFSLSGKVPRMEKAEASPSITELRQADSNRESLEFREYLERHSQMNN